MSSKARRSYLVTGGAGFIGSNFVRHLYDVERPVEVTVLDKLGYSGNLENLADFEERPGFRFIHGDICDPAAVAEAVASADVVVNFAAEVSVDRSIEDPQGFLQTDVLGVHTLLESCREVAGFQRFVQISTDEVYGQIFEGSFAEDVECRPRNPYSASKLGGERLAYSYSETYGMPVVITRSSNTYGPYAYPEKVIPLFITNLLDGLQVPLFGEGRQIRDWLHVEDHCSAIHCVIEKGAAGEVYNVGGGEECSNLELARLLLELAGCDESFIRFVADRPGHDFRYSVETSKLRELGWRPRFTLAEGLRRTFAWYRDNEDWWRPLKQALDQRYQSGFWGASQPVALEGDA